MGKALDNMIDGFLMILCTGASVIVIVGVWFMMLAMFNAHPTGYYIKASESGYVTEVYQDIKYGTDRLVFTGPNGMAWEAYKYLTKPELKPEPLYKTL